MLDKDARHSSQNSNDEMKKNIKKHIDLVVIITKHNVSMMVIMVRMNSINIEYKKETTVVQC